MSDEQNDAVQPTLNEPLGVSEQLQPSDGAWREGWANAYSGANLYIGGGELQDNAMLPFIDWRRDSADDIRRKIVERGMEKARSQQPGAQKPALFVQHEWEKELSRDNDVLAGREGDNTGEAPFTVPLYAAPTLRAVTDDDVEALFSALAHFVKKADVRAALEAMLPHGVPVEVEVLRLALESLDQIGAMTKAGRASLHARATEVFIRTQMEARNDDR